MKKDVLAYLGIEENDSLPLVLEKIEKALKGKIKEEKLQKILFDVQTHYKTPLKTKNQSFLRKQTKLQSKDLQVKKQNEEVLIQEYPSSRRWQKIGILILSLFQVILIPFLFSYSIQTIESGFELDDAVIVFILSSLLIINSMLLFIGSFFPKDSKKQAVSLYTRLHLPGNMLLSYVNIRILILAVKLSRYFRIPNESLAEELIFQLIETNLPKMIGWIFMISLAMILFLMAIIVQFYSLIRRKELLWIKDVKQDVTI